MYKTFEQRKGFLTNFQKKVLEKFPDTSDYNIHFFGSFVTNHFNPKRSDIDLGIVCLNSFKCFEIAECVEELLKDSGIPYDLIIINKLEPKQYVNYNILGSPYCITDYRPEGLFRYMLSLKRDYFEFNKSREFSERMIKKRGVR